MISLLLSCNESKIKPNRLHLLLPLLTNAIMVLYLFCLDLVALLLLSLLTNAIMVLFLLRLDLFLTPSHKSLYFHHFFRTVYLVCKLALCPVPFLIQGNRRKRRKEEETLIQQRQQHPKDQRFRAVSRLQVLVLIPAKHVIIPQVVLLG